MKSPTTDEGNIVADTHHRNGNEGEELDHRYSIQDFTLAHEIAFNAVLCMCQLMTQAGLAMTIVPLHIIGDHFGVENPGQLSWLAAVSRSIGYGSLTDISSGIFAHGRHLYSHRRPTRRPVRTPQHAPLRLGLLWRFLPAYRILKLGQHAIHGFLSSTTRNRSGISAAQCAGRVGKVIPANTPQGYGVLPLWTVCTLRIHPWRCILRLARRTTMVAVDLLDIGHYLFRNGGSHLFRRTA